MTELRELLRSRADNVRTTALVDGSIQRGRSLQRRRTTGTVLGCLALLGALGATYAQIASQGLDAAPPAETDPATEWTALPSTMTFMDEYGQSMWRVPTDGEPELIQLPVDPDFGSVGAWTVSPDGTSFSFVDEFGLGVGPADTDMPIHMYEAKSLCATQSWSPDSREIMLGDCFGDAIELVFISVTDGEELRRISDVGNLGTAFYVGGGEQIVWGNNVDGYTIADVDGENRRPFDVGEVPLDPEDIWLPAQMPPGEPYPTSRRVTGTSSDGRLVCHDVTWNDVPEADPYSVGWHPGEDTPAFIMNSATANTDCDVLLDTTTGEPVRVPGATLDGAVFGPQGETLLGVIRDDGTGYELRLMDADWQLLDTRLISGLDLDYEGSSALRSYR
ncbi:hypothetical protein [Stackebrandtia soli]|uniref:hypothetical protein n=1 Tax=Stackebrandtia soli TaxID=1892856 RepID=UPI0039E9418C